MNPASLTESLLLIIVHILLYGLFQQDQIPLKKIFFNKVLGKLNHGEGLLVFIYFSPGPPLVDE